MAEPKGTYYSPQTPEQGWATVIPQQPRSNFFRTLAQMPMAQIKAKQADEKAKQATLAKLTGADVGRFHHDSYQTEVDRLFKEAPGLSAMELQERVVKLSGLARATKDVAKMYDTDRKWSEGKDVPIKKEEWARAYTEKNYMNPDMNTAAEWSQNPPDKAWFLKEDGGGQFVDQGRAMKRVIRDNFKETLTTQTLETGGWNKIPIGYEKENLTFKHKLQAFARVEGDEIVIKGYEELIKTGVLEAFTSDEYTERLLIDKAKEMQAAAGKPTGDDDISQLELGKALEEMLQPYVAGAVQESGVTLTIRPSGGGGGGGSQKFAKGFDLWVKEWSAGGPAATNYIVGAKTEAGEVVNLAPAKRDVAAIYTDPAKLRQRLDRESWFRGLNDSQKAEVISGATKSASQSYDPNNPAEIYHVVTFREKLTKSSSSPEGERTSETTGYKYSVQVMNPNRMDRGFLSLLYAGGRKARGNTDFDVVVSGGQMGYEFEEEADAWQAPNAPQPKPQAKRKPM